MRKQSFRYQHPKAFRALKIKINTLNRDWKCVASQWSFFRRGDQHLKIAFVLKQNIWNGTRNVTAGRGLKRPIPPECAPVISTCTFFYNFVQALVISASNLFPGVWFSSSSFLFIARFDKFTSFSFLSVSASSDISQIFLQTWMLCLLQVYCILGIILSRHLRPLHVSSMIRRYSPKFYFVP